MKKLNFLWIDDYETRRKKAENLSNNIIKITFNSVQQKDPISEIKNINLMIYDLILIDHRLNDSINSNFRGTTLAEFIRAEYSKIPIVGITAEKNFKLINLQTEKIYDYFLYTDELGENVNNLINIAKGFKRLNIKENKSFIRKLNLLKAPEAEIERIKQIIPIESNLGMGERLSTRLFANWVLHDLIDKPGFLYDKKWTANLIGLKETSFRKVEKLFFNAEYKGIFSNNKDKRWWKIKIKEIVFQKTNNKIYTLPWEAGHELHGIKKNDFSICYSCNKIYPETIGYTDLSQNRCFVPLHIRCSQNNPNDRRKLFFDEIRLMKDN